MNELRIKNPYDGEEIANLSFETDEEIRRALDEGLRAWVRWRSAPSFERAELLNAVAAELRTRRDELAALIRQEAGKPIRLAELEVERAIGVLSWAAGEAQRFGGELLRIDASRGGRPGFGIAQRFPRGLILGITPFNFPLNLAVHKIAPAIACGCPIIIKPSPAAPLSVLKLEEIFRKCAPPGAANILQVVLADDEQTAALTRAPEIAMVTFTGSARVGALIRAQAPHKPVTLELGGNAWAIVLDDVPEADWNAIARRIAMGAFGYAGQSCISVQNVAISGKLWPKLLPLLQESTLTTPFGDPLDPETVSGPLIHAAAARQLRARLALAPKNWAMVEANDRRGAMPAEGALLEPRLLIRPDAAAADHELIREELFGPVMIAAPFDELDGLSRIINSGHYGLQAGVFTQNWSAIEKLYRDLEVGGLVVNDIPTTRYDHQPYGGVKDSGEGREGVKSAMEEMTRTKFLALSSRIP